MQYLSQYFPVMPTWTNIESVMIVQPNGTILSQYREISDRKRKKYLKMSPRSSDNQSLNSQEKQKKDSSEYSLQKKLVKEKLNNISKQVIESSRKLFRGVYQDCLNKLIIDKNLVYYRAKYNVLVIVVVKKFSVEIQEIEELIQKVFSWYSEKCASMNIEMNIPNLPIGRYELGQFKKLEWEIAHQIDERVSTSQIDKLPILPRLGQETYIKEKFQNTAQMIINREEKLKEIGDKASFDENDSQTSSKLSHPDKVSFLKNITQKLFPSIFDKKQQKTRKFKRQLSFMEKSVMVAKEMKIKLILFWICLIVAITLGGMVYFGWFQEEDL